MSACELLVGLIEPLARFSASAEDGPQDFNVAIERIPLAADK